MEEKRDSFNKYRWNSSSNFHIKLLVAKITKCSFIILIYLPAIKTNSSEKCLSYQSNACHITTPVIKFRRENGFYRSMMFIRVDFPLEMLVFSSVI